MHFTLILPQKLPSTRKTTCRKSAVVSIGKRSDTFFNILKKPFHCHQTLAVLRKNKK